MNERQKQLNDFRMALAQSDGYATFERPGLGRSKIVEYVDHYSGGTIAMEIRHQNGKDTEYLVFVDVGANESEELEKKKAELKERVESMKLELINVDSYIKLIELKMQLTDRVLERGDHYEADLSRVAVLLRRIEEQAK